MIQMQLYAVGFEIAGRHSVYNLALLPAQTSANSVNSRVLLILIGVCAFALIMQAVMATVLAFSAMRTFKEGLVHTRDVKARVLTLIASSQGILSELAPEIQKIALAVGSIATQVEVISVIGRTKVLEVAPTVSAVNESLKAANRQVRTLGTIVRTQVIRWLQ